MLRMPADCFSQWRAPDGVVHAAHLITYDHCYAGWWLSACNVSFVHGEGKGTHDAPTCLLCVGSKTYRRVLEMEPA